MLLEDDKPRALAPFDVATPWWQDVTPIVEALPGIAVLRLLSGTPAPGHVMGGEVTYLAERLPTALAPSTQWHTTPWRGTLTDDPLRLPWALPGGPAADLTWACSKVDAVGTPTQDRTWNLSAVWSIHTTSGVAWLKCVPPFSEHEAAVLELLAGHPVPRLLASDRHRQLLAGMPGVDGFGASLEQRLALIDALVAIQVWSMPRTDELLERGVPDGRWHALLGGTRDLVARRRPDDPRLAALLATAEDRIATIEACGLPDVLVHGDAHEGNARIGPGTGSGIWFDWSDSKVGHPLLDVAVLARARPEDAGALCEHWLAAWGRALPGSDPHRAWPLVRPLAALSNAVVYQGFLDGIEQSERIYHRDDVEPCLLRAAELTERSAELGNI